MSKPSLLFVIPTLGHGGAQKILVEIVQNVSPEYEVTVLTLRENSKDVYSVGGYAELLTLDVVRDNRVSLSTVLEAPIKLRAIIKEIEPAVVVSFQDIANFAVLLGSVSMKRVRIIVSERQDTRFYSFAFLRKILRIVLYSRSDSIVVQTQLIQQQFPVWLRRKIVIIPNQITPFGTANPVEPNHQGIFRVVSAGRFENQKDFKILIAAARYLVEDFKNWRVEIYGSGSLRDELTQMIQAYKLEDFVFLKKPHKKLGMIFKSSNLFVLPSVYEGFPNVLAEAVCCGLPAIAFDGVSGTSELIKHGENGYLVGKRCPIALSEKMRLLMENALLRESYGTRARSLVSNFRPEIVFNKWDELIEHAQDIS